MSSTRMVYMRAFLSNQNKAMLMQMDGGQYIVYQQKPLA